MSPIGACSAVFFPLIIADIWEKLDAPSQEYFRREREAKYEGVRLEDLQMGREVCLALPLFMLLSLPHTSYGCCTFVGSKRQSALAICDLQ